MMKCPKKYSLQFLCLHMDGALKYQFSIAEHLEECFSCQSKINFLQQVEQQIEEYEKNQENYVSFEVFDTIHQRRDIIRLAWQPTWIGFNEYRHLVERPPTSTNCLKLYLQHFWYGKIGIYVQNLEFPLPVRLQRKRKYLAIDPGKSQRIVADEALLVLSEQYLPMIKISLSIPSAFRENSMTRTYKSLAHISQSFVTLLFQKKSLGMPAVKAWEHVKRGLSVRDIGIYLMRLNTNFPYDRIAKDFRIAPTKVGKIVLKIRKKLLSLCLEK